MSEVPSGTAAQEFGTGAIPSELIILGREADPRPWLRPQQIEELFDRTNFEAMGIARPRPESILAMQIHVEISPRRPWVEGKGALNAYLPDLYRPGFIRFLGPQTNPGKGLDLIVSGLPPQRFKFMEIQVYARPRSRGEVGWFELQENSWPPFPKQRRAAVEFDQVLSVLLPPGRPFYTIGLSSLDLEVWEFHGFRVWHF